MALNCATLFKPMSKIVDLSRGTCFGLPISSQLFIKIDTMCIQNCNQSIKGTHFCRFLTIFSLVHCHPSSLALTGLLLSESDMTFCIHYEFNYEIFQVLILLGRAVNIFPLSFILNFFREHKITRKNQFIMWFSGE